LGRTLQVPSGCAVVPTNASGGRVLCEDGTDFAWAEAATLSEKELTSRRDATTAMMAAASGAVERKMVPCVVEGTPTQCRQLDEKRGKVAVRHYVGAANVANGRALVVTCGSLAGQPKTLAPVCNGVLALP
ncbi:MAG TPA: hypothetical protein VK420_19135, partial [Longimicrobium sp.]|nr:hypothetical protein [Longimicrobium sp.]